MKLSLKMKTILLIVSIAALISVVSIFLCNRMVKDVIRVHYNSRVTEIADTVAISVDPEQVRSVRDAVLEIYNATENKVLSDQWGSPEFEEYVARFDGIDQTEDFLLLRERLRQYLEVNQAESLYITWLDAAGEKIVYLTDASKTEACPPGCIDMLFEENRQTLTHPEEGFRPLISNTEEYGWLITAGRPIYAADGEILGYACADISMNDIMSQQRAFLVIISGSLVTLAVLFSVLGIHLVDRFIVRPINILSQASVRYCNGEAASSRHKFADLNIRTGDEIQTLADSMTRMERDINDYITDLLNATKELISAEKQAKKLDQLANIDALTRVRNKRAYDVEITRIGRDLEEGKTDFALAMIDLNFLKLLNDTYGHEKGDLALKELCRIICQIFQHSPVFRVGGDEFVVILENGDFANAEELVGQFNETIKNVQADSSLEPWMRVSAAIGWTAFDPKADSDMRSVFKRADEAMYQRKIEMKAKR